MTATGRRARAIALAALLGVAAGLVVALLAGGGGGYELQVQVDDAAGLRKDFDVKIAGTPVGRVVDVDLDEDDRAVAELRIDEAAAPVGEDATVAIRASNLLGEKYVDLEPGDPSRPAPSGTLIPRSRTETPSDLNDLLAVLNEDTRLALAAFLSNQGEALLGRGEDLAEAIDRLPRTLDGAHELIAALGADNRALGSLVERSDRILASVGPEREALGRLVDEASAAFAVIASRREDLGATVAQAPGALRQLQSSLTHLERLAIPLGPAARGLSASAPPLTETLEELPAFADAARPTLGVAREIAPRLELLGRQGAPGARRLVPLASQLRGTSGDLRPVTKLADDAVPDLLALMQGWSRAIQTRDAAGHIFRVNAQLSDDALNALGDYVSTGPQARQRSAPNRSRSRIPRGGPRVPDAGQGVSPPKAPVPPVKLPKLPKVPGADGLLDKLGLSKGAPGGKGKGKPKDNPPPAISDLLDFLLGP